MTPAKIYFVQDLHLPIDLLRGNPPKTEGDSSSENYLGKVKRKLEEIHEGVRKQIDIKSSRTKTSSIISKPDRSILRSEYSVVI